MRLYNGEKRIPRGPGGSFIRFDPFSFLFHARARNSFGNVAKDTRKSAQITLPMKINIQKMKRKNALMNSRHMLEVTQPTRRNCEKLRSTVEGKYCFCQRRMVQSTPNESIFDAISGTLFVLRLHHQYLWFRNKSKFIYFFHPSTKENCFYFRTFCETVSGWGRLLTDKSPP